MPECPASQLATKADGPTLSTVLGVASQDDPAMSFIFPDAEERRRRPPPYLETGTEKNVHFYKRLGFVVTQTWHVRNGPMLWSMLRPVDG